jgi:hypothetical protein
MGTKRLNRSLLAAISNWSLTVSLNHKHYPEENKPNINRVERLVTQKMRQYLERAQQSDGLESKPRYMVLTQDLVQTGFELAGGTADEMNRSEPHDQFDTLPTHNSDNRRG